MFGSQSMPASSPYGMSQTQGYLGSSNPSFFGTTTGHSKLVATKTIRGEVQAMDPGSGFNDAGSLASTIKIQNTTSTIQNIDVSNNDGGAIAIPTQGQLYTCCRSKR